MSVIAYCVSLGCISSNNKASNVDVDLSGGRLSNLRCFNISGVYRPTLPHELKVLTLLEVVFYHQAKNMQSHQCCMILNNLNPHLPQITCQSKSAGLWLLMMFEFLYVELFSLCGGDSVSVCPNKLQPWNASLPAHWKILSSEWCTFVQICGRLLLKELNLKTLETVRPCSIGPNLFFLGLTALDLCLTPL